MANQDDMQRLRNGEIDLSYCDFTKADLSRMNLNGRNFSHSRLSGTKIIESDLSDTKFIQSLASGADLSESKFRDSDLSYSQFVRVNFSGSVFNNVNFNHGTFHLSTFDGCVFIRCSFLAASLQGATFNSCVADRYTDFNTAQLLRAEASAAVFGRYLFSEGRLKLRTDLELNNEPDYYGDNPTNFESMSTVSRESQERSINGDELTEKINFNKLTALAGRPASIENSLRVAAHLILEEIAQREGKRPNDPDALAAHEEYGRVLARTAQELSTAADAIAAGDRAANETDSAPLFEKAAARLSVVRSIFNDWVRSDMADVVIAKALFVGAGTVALTGLLASLSGNGSLSLVVSAAVIGGPSLPDAVRKIWSGMRSRQEP